MIRAIETTYNGYNFRSRTEARWAVWMDYLGVPYEYEKEGFDLAGIKYLPDFWLPRQECWLEIKGEKPSDAEEHKAFLLAEASAQPVIICSGQCGVTVNSAYKYRYDSATSVLADSDYRLKIYTGYHNLRGFPVCRKLEGFFWEEWLNSLQVFLAEKFPDKTIPRYNVSHDDLLSLINLDRAYYREKYGTAHPRYIHGMVNDAFGWTWDNGLCIGWTPLQCSIRLLSAFNAARSARFEFGHSGAT